MRSKDRMAILNASLKNELEKAKNGLEIAEKSLLSNKNKIENIESTKKSLEENKKNKENFKKQIEQTIEKGIKDQPRAKEIQAKMLNNNCSTAAQIDSRIKNFSVAKINSMLEFNGLQRISILANEGLANEAYQILMKQRESIIQEINFLDQEINALDQQLSACKQFGKVIELQLLTSKNLFKKIQETSANHASDSDSESESESEQADQEMNVENDGKQEMQLN